MRITPKHMRWSLALALLLPLQLLGQPSWTGILSSNRAYDWGTYAGISGGLPDGSWTQCVNTQCATVTTAGTSAISAQISAALANAPNDTYVLLASGTYNLTGAIDFGKRSNVVLRGAGSNSTFLVFTGSGVGCNGNSAIFCVQSNDGTYWGGNTPVNWTAGYSQGTTVVTLSSVTSPTTLAVGDILFLNQCDDGRSGSGCTGTETDTGNYFNCGDQWVSPNGCSQSGPDGGNGTTSRFQTEAHIVTNISGLNVTLAEPIGHPNFVSGRSPQAWWVVPVTNVGIESLSVDGSGSTAYWGAEFLNASNVWFVNSRVSKVAGQGLNLEDVSHSIVRNNYIFAPRGSDGFGIKPGVTSFNLFENNICEQTKQCIVAEGDDSQSVWSYNYSTQQSNYQAFPQGDGLSQAFRPHSNGTDLLLIEGNVGTNYYADKDHGTHNLNTLFRNFFYGWESCGISQTMGSSGPCGNSTPTQVKDFQTQAIDLAQMQGRYHNILANVLGAPGYHTAYSYTNPTVNNLAIYALGSGWGAGSPTNNLDATTSMLWGNYNVVSGTLWNTGEVPSGISVYPNAVPTGNCTSISTCPASFYLAAQPSWWPNTIPFPAIGPEVAGGNVGQIAGTLNVSGSYNGMPALVGTTWNGSMTNTAWAGHVNAIPAMSCYFNHMAGSNPSGIHTAPLPFDASVCYASAPPPPGPPTGLSIIVLQ